MSIRLFVTLPLAALSATTALSALPVHAAPGNVAPRATTVAREAIPTLKDWTYKLTEVDEGAATAPPSWTWTSRLEARGAYELRFAFNAAGANDYLLLRVQGNAARSTWRFWRVRAGQIEKLGEPEATLPMTRGQLTVQRSPWRVRALWNGRVVVTAFNNIQTGLYACAAHGAVQQSGERIQPTEKVFLQDDFMRAQGPDDAESPGEWHRVAGVWKTSGLLNPRAQAELNPNPFVFRAEVAPKLEAGTAIATIGNATSSAGNSKWFWSDYTVTASVRPTLKNLKGPLVASLGAYHQPDGATVTGNIDFKTGRATLKMGDQVLATSEPFHIAPDQWHRVFLDPGPGTLRLLVDGVERLRTDLGALGTGELAQGQPALLATVGGGNYVDFDDVRIGANDAIRDDFRTAAVGRWDDAQGEWKTRTAGNAGRVKLNPGPALTLTGDPQREEGQVEGIFSFAGKTSEPAGVAFAARDARNFFLARLRNVAGKGMVELVEYTDGNGKILGSAALSKLPPAAQRPVITAGWRDGTIQVQGAGASLTVTVNTVPAGRVGAWADGPALQTALASFRALGAPPNWGEGALPERFQKDHLMAHWASNAKSWKSGNDGVWWHGGDFFGDATVTAPIPALGPDATVTLLVAADPKDPLPGGRLVIDRNENSLDFNLVEAGKSVRTFKLSDKPAKAGTPDLAEPPTAKDVTGQHLVRYTRRPLDAGHVLLRVVLDGRVIMNETATVSEKTDSDATRVGVRLANVPALEWEKVVANTSHMLDYTFTSAPVDWEAATGRWEVKERWTCSPQWGFFAGTDAVNPMLWSRFAVQGDFTLEAYLATPMDLTRGERDPMDLNLTVGGDGRDLASGYSFLFGAKNRTATRIMRGDTNVIDKAFELPAGVGSTHQDWFYVRVERRRTPEGMRFRYSVNGREFGVYTDPQPLEKVLGAPGRIAFWTYNGGLSIARVRLWYQDLHTDAAPAVTDVMPLTLNTTYKNVLGEWRPRVESVSLASAHLKFAVDSGHSALKITNPQSGGDWTVFVTRKPFDAVDRPMLNFKYKVPAGVAINLYALVDRQWREIVLTGEQTTAANVTLLGKIDGAAADNRWHTASFDLLAALRKAIDQKVTRVEALAFAAPDREYLRVGLGGNRLGATYWLSDFDAPEVTKTTTPPPTLALKPDTQ